MSDLNLDTEPRAPGRRRFWGNPTVGLFIRLWLAYVWFFAGISKLRESDGAREQILGFRIFPVDWATPLGWALPAVEVLLAVLLLLGLFTRIAAIATFVLQAAFIVGIVSVWIRGYDVQCGCFGKGASLIPFLPDPVDKDPRYAVDILRDSFFMGCAAWLAVWPYTRWGLDRDPNRVDHWADHDDHDDPRDDHEHHEHHDDHDDPRDEETNS